MLTLDDLARIQAAHHAEMRSMLAGLAAALAMLQSAQRTAPPKLVTPADAATMARLMPQLFAIWPAAVFTAAEVAAVADLHQAVGRALGARYLRARSPAKCIGRLLARCDGAAFAGLQFQVIRERSPLLFLVSKAAETPETRAAA